MFYSESNKLKHVEKLLDVCKFDEAIKLLDDLVQLEGLSFQQKVSFVKKFLKIEIINE